MLNIEIKPEDIQQTVNSNPLFAAQVQIQALIRMVTQRDAQIADLIARLQEYEGATPGENGVGVPGGVGAEARSKS